MRKVVVNKLSDAKLAASKLFGTNGVPAHEVREALQELIDFAAELRDSLSAEENDDE